MRLPCLLVLVAAGHVTFANAAPPAGYVSATNAKAGLTVERPSGWIEQALPNPETVFMFGLSGPGYGGNCNINSLPSPATVNLTQDSIDQTENRRPLGAEFFLRTIDPKARDPKINHVSQDLIGSKWGHLVDYSHNYVELSTSQIVYMRTIMFSHSSPGRVTTFTCGIGSASSKSTTQAVKSQAANIRHLIVTFKATERFLRVDPALVPHLFSEPRRPAQLNTIQRWRYDSCRQEALKAPTTVGVNKGLRLCDEKFEQ